MAHILIAEDEQVISKLMMQNLHLVGHTVDQAWDGVTALQMAEENNYDVIILDVMLPQLSGFEILKRLTKDTPVIYVTAKTSLDSKLEGLDLGAEDYITKPFEMLELLARVRVVLRRTQKEATGFSFAGTEVDLLNRLVQQAGQEVSLTPKEFELLEVLVSNRNIALSRERLLEMVWGYDFLGDTRTVDVHIQRLRKKLGWEEYIQTVYKMGYRLQTKGNE